MTATATPEYRKLELESSNDIIRHDARRSDRKYPEAALHAREAGLARVRMGQMMFDAGDFPQAVADWLSAAACFYLATDPMRMREALNRVQKLDPDVHIAVLFDPSAALSMQGVTLVVDGRKPKGADATRLHRPSVVL